MCATAAPANIVATQKWKEPFVFQGKEIFYLRQKVLSCFRISPV